LCNQGGWQERYEEQEQLEAGPGHAAQGKSAKLKLQVALPVGEPNMFRSRLHRKKAIEYL